MVRLDKLLVRKGYFSSRERAKEAIRRGLVRVDGRVVTKPSYEVGERARIEVLAPVDAPRGYWKLMDLDERWGIIRGGDVVLDLGSSAGGFLLYASQKARAVYGIEYSRRFEDALRRIERERGNVKVFIEDALKFDINRLPELDVILLDLTVEPEVAYRALMRFLPKLRDGGRVLFVEKVGLKDVRLDFEAAGLRVVREERSPSKKERYYLLVKGCGGEPSQAR